MAHIDGAINRTGLDDAQIRLILSRLTEQDPSPWDRVWYVDMNDHDEDWRLLDGAPNQWQGTISEDGGDEVFDFTDVAGIDVGSFKRAWDFVCWLVTEHNLRLLAQMEERGPAHRK